MPLPSARRPLRALAATLAPLAVLVAAARPTAPRAVDAFVVAHPDDWQLFMGDVAVDKVRAGHRVVLVYATTGDAGAGDAYWQARERGALASAAFLVGVAPPDSANVMTGGQRPPACTDTLVAGRSVRRCRLEETVSYFLRLPDGNVNGSGFAATDSVSLLKLAAGGPPMRPMTGTGEYRTRADLDSVVAAVLRAESRGIRRVTVHATDPDSAFNPGEHADHRQVGLAAAAVAAAQRWSLVQYASYSIMHRPANLDAERYARKAGLFLAYDRARILGDARWSAYCESPRAYSSWLSRTYARPASAATRAERR